MPTPNEINPRDLDNIQLNNLLNGDTSSLDNTEDPENNIDNSNSSEPGQDNSENSEQNLTDKSSEYTKKDVNTNEINQNAEPEQDNSVIIDDVFIDKFGKDYSPEFVAKIKGKSFSDIVKQVEELEKLKGKQGAEIGELRKKLGQNQNQETIKVQGLTNNQLQAIDWKNKDSAIPLIIHLKMKQLFPDFENIDSINEMPLLTAGDSKKANDMLNAYERFTKEAETEYTQIADEIKSAPAANWDTVTKTVNEDIKGFMELTDVSFDEIGLSNDQIKLILTSINPEFKTHSKFEDNLASLLLLDENGNADQNLFAKDHLGVFRVNPLAVNAKFRILTNDLIKQAKESKRIQIIKEAQNKGFQQAVTNKPNTTLSNSSISGKMDVDTPDPNNPSSLTNEQINEILKGN